MTLGTTRPPNPAMQGFVRCMFTECGDVLPMRLGSDSQRVLELMTDYGYQTEQIASYRSGTDYMFTAEGQCDVMMNIPNDDAEWARSIFFGNCPNFRLGDLLTLVDDPRLVGVDGQMVLVFERGVYVRLQTDSWFTWNTPVSHISVLERSGGLPTFEWEGVMPRRYYCQSQPDCRAAYIC
jgi:hypothetical protein